MILPILHSVFTLVLLVGAFGFMFVKLGGIAALINAGRHVENLTDTKTERWMKVVKNVFFHKKVLEDPVSGLLHVFFLYGFMILGIGHFEIVLEGLTAFFAVFDGKPFR